MINEDADNSRLKVIEACARRLFGTLDETVPYWRETTFDFDNSEVLNSEVHEAWRCLAKALGELKNDDDSTANG